MKFRDLHRNVKVRVVESFASNIVSNMIFPFMGIYFAEHYGAGRTGVLLVVNVLFTIIAGGFGGYFADRFGRKRMMLVAEPIRLLAFAVMALCNSSWFVSPMLTFGMLLVISICGGLSFPAVEAMLVDVSTPESRKLIFSIDYWSINASVLIGGILGGFLFKRFLFELLVMIAMTSLFSLILIVFFITETHFAPSTESPEPDAAGHVPAKRSEGMLGSYRSVFQDGTFLLFALASTLALSIEPFTNNYMAIRLANEMGHQTILSFQDFRLAVDGIRMFGILQAENALFVILLALFITRLLKRFSDIGILSAGVLLGAAGYCVLGISNIPWILMLFLAVATLGELMFFPVKQAYLAQIVPATNRGTYMAVNSLSGVLARLFGSIGVTLGAYFPSAVMGGIILFMGCASVLLYQMIHPRVEARKVEVSV